MNHESPTDQPSTDGDLHRIREILFGAQSRELATCLSRLEERLTRELQELRTENQRRAEHLESLIREQSAALTASLQAAQSQRESGDQALDGRIAALGDALRGEIQALRNATPERTSLGDMFKELATRLGAPS